MTYYEKYQTLVDEITTKVVVVGGVGLISVGSFLLGRVTKKSPKAAKVTPKATN